MKKRFIPENKSLSKKLKYGLGQTGFRLLTQLIIIINLGKDLSIGETITWGGLSTLTALVMMLEFGFNSTLSRNYNYVLNGSQRLFRNTFDKPGNTLNLELLSNLRISVKYYYIFITIIFLVIAIVFFTYFLPFKNLQNEERIACIIHIGYLVMLISSFNEETIVIGMDKIDEHKKNQLIGSSIGITSFLLLLSFDQLLIAFSTNLLISTLAVKILNRKFISNKLNKDVNGSFDIDILKTLLPNTFKIGLTGLMGFTLSKMYYFVGSRKLMEVDFSMLILTFSVYGMIESFASLYGQLLYAKMIKDNSQNRMIDLKNNILAAHITQVVIFIISTLVLHVTIPLLISFRDELRLLSLELLILISVYRYVENNIGLNGMILTIENRVPFFKPAIYSGILSLILYIGFYRINQINTLTIILIPLITQLIFQFFRWNNKVFYKYIKV